jgi:hypothetical protein
VSVRRPKLDPRVLHQVLKPSGVAQTVGLLKKKKQRTKKKKNTVNKSIIQIIDSTNVFG